MEMEKSIHRRTTLGETLNETLDEMISKTMITIQTKEEILKAFDKIILKYFKTIKNKVILKGIIGNYDNLDNVWNLDLKHVKLIDDSDMTQSLSLLKIIALSLV